MAQIDSLEKLEHIQIGKNRYKLLLKIIKERPLN